MKLLLLTLIAIFTLPETQHVTMPVATLCMGTDTVVFGGTEGLMFSNDSPNVVTAAALDGVNITVHPVSVGSSTITYYPSMSSDVIYVYPIKVTQCN